MPMTRRDIILKWTSYLTVMFLVAVVNYYVLGPLPISLPLLLPVLAVAGGTLEGAPFGAVYGAACGMVMSWAIWGRGASSPCPCSGGCPASPPNISSGGTPGGT